MSNRDDLRARLDAMVQHEAIKNNWRPLDAPHHFNLDLP